MSCSAVKIYNEPTCCFAQSSGRGEALLECDVQGEGGESGYSLEAIIFIIMAVIRGFKDGY
jgi:hypothetical protein